MFFLLSSCLVLERTVGGDISRWFLANHLPLSGAAPGRERPSGTLSWRRAWETGCVVENHFPVSDALPTISAFPLSPRYVCLGVRIWQGARTRELACFSERIVLIWNWQRGRKYFPNWGWLMDREGGKSGWGGGWKPSERWGKEQEQEKIEGFKDVSVPGFRRRCHHLRDILYRWCIVLRAEFLISRNWYQSTGTFLSLQAFLSHTALKCNHSSSFEKIKIKAHKSKIIGDVWHPSIQSFSWFWLNLHELIWTEELFDWDIFLIYYCHVELLWLKCYQAWPLSH